MFGCFYTLMASYFYHILSQNDVQICETSKPNHGINIFESDSIPSINFLKYIRAYEDGPFVYLGEHSNPEKNEEILMLENSKYSTKNCIINYKTNIGSELRDCSVGVMNTCFENNKFYGFALQMAFSNLRSLLEGRSSTDSSEEESSEDLPLIGDELFKFNTLDYEDNKTNSIETITDEINNVCKCKNKINMDIYLNFSDYAKNSENVLEKFCLEYENKEILKYDLQLIPENRKFILTIYNKFHSTIIDEKPCYTDSTNFFPTIMNGYKQNRPPDRIQYTFDIQQDGYYWCTLPWLSMNVQRTKKYLYVYDRESLKRRWAIMIQTDRNIIPKLRNYGSEQIFIRNTFQNLSIEERFSQMNLTMQKIQLKRVYITDKLKLLYHITLSSDVFINKGYFSGDVLYVQNLWGCSTSMLFDKIEDKIIPINTRECIAIKDQTECVEYECIGDFNTGAYWTKMDFKSQFIAETVRFDRLPKSLDSTLIEDSTALEAAPLTLDILRKPTLNKADIANVIDNVENLILFSRGSITSSIPMDIENAISKIDLSIIGGQMEMMRKSIGLAIFESAQFPYKTIKFGRDINNLLSFNYFNEELSSSPANEDDAQVLIDAAHISKYEGRVALTYYENDTLFGNIQDKVHKVNSPIVSMSIAGVNALHENDTIQIHFRPRENVLTKSQIKVCAFWDNNTWSSEGCKLIAKSSIPGLETCQCNHLTHFALLVKSHNNPLGEVNERVLTVLTCIGCALSLFGVIVICLTGIRFRNWRKEFSNKIWMNLSVAIGILIITFLVNAILYAERKSSGVCVLLGASLHYSVLATFCWMFMAAVLAYKKLVQVFNMQISNRVLKLCLIGWLVPLIPVVLLLLISSKSYHGHLGEFESYKEFCYPSGLGFMLTVLFPIVMIIIINAILLVTIIRSIFFSKGVRYHGDKKELQRRISVSFLLFFLFGMSWVFGLMSRKIVFNYLFCITTSLQGFIMFLFFIVANEKTRILWLPKKKKQVYDITQSTTDTLMQVRAKREIASL